MDDQTTSSVLAHIVSRMTNHTEDIAVEALGCILQQSSAARRGLRDLLERQGLDIGEL